jgi:hypothetical protein
MPLFHFFHIQEEFVSRSLLILHCFECPASSALGIEHETDLRLMQVNCRDPKIGWSFGTL